MRFCIECFRDYEIRAIIQHYKKVGRCSVCGSKEIEIYDSSEDDYLQEYFEGLIDIYATEDKLSSDFPIEKLHYLQEEMSLTWNIFNTNISDSQIKCILKEICKDRYTEEPELFNKKVGISESSQLDYLKKNSIVKEHTWEQFVTSIKSECRFHSNIFNEEVLEILCSYMSKSYDEGHVFYRSRISGQRAYSPEEMSAPPVELATAGRANPEGISYLYLADTIKTTIHEIKAGQYDYVSVGEFELNKKINIVDLTGIENISAFSDLDFKQHAINRVHLKKINNEIAKPLRRHDSKLDYLPTQYICDFIKSIKSDEKNLYDGIKYKSTMNVEGYNIVIFDKDVLTCTKVRLLDIEKIEYQTTEL